MYFALVNKSETNPSRYTPASTKFAFFVETFLDGCQVVRMFDKPIELSNLIKALYDGA